MPDSIQSPLSCSVRCNICANRTFANVKGLTRCLACQAGTRYDIQLASTGPTISPCVGCLAGTYRDHNRTGAKIDNNCTKCVAGKWSSTSSSTCSDCAGGKVAGPGTSVVAVVALAAGAASSAAASAGAASSAAASAGAASSAAASAGVAVAVVAAATAATAATAVAAELAQPPPAELAQSTAAEAAAITKEGRKHNSTHLSLHNGTTGFSACIDCQAGYYSSSATECLQCVAGRSSSTSSSTCTDCEPGKVGRESGA